VPQLPKPHQIDEITEVDLQQRLAKCHAPIFAPAAYFGKTNLNGMDKIQTFPGINQVDPDTPSVLPDESNAHPGNIAVEFLQWHQCFGHLLPNQIKLIAQVGILPTNAESSVAGKLVHLNNTPNNNVFPV
jgi:hypothetical protein